MEELDLQLARLYLPEGVARGGHPAGRVIDPVRDGAVRAIVVPFELAGEGTGESRWEQLCAVANALQGELGLPAPAVSVSGATGFRLWLSFTEAVPVQHAQRFLELLRTAYFADVKLPAEGVRTPLELPPRPHPATGKWAAFIHPGMGAAFAEEPALDIPPPPAAQAALLADLQGITPAQLQEAFEALERDAGRNGDQAGDRHRVSGNIARTPVTGTGVEETFSKPDLLLKDATLEDIVRFLHAKNIEPTFRHLIGRE